MTDNEIIKALEKKANEKRCLFEQYEEACGMWCEYHHKWCADMSGIDNKQNCAEYTPSSDIRIAKEILDLVNRQKAEIERLNKVYKEQVERTIADAKELIVQYQRNAIEDFEERLKRRFRNLEWKANTTRKTMAIEEVKEQIQWILQDVCIETITELAKEMVTML